MRFRVRLTIGIVSALAAQAVWAEQGDVFQLYKQASGGQKVALQKLTALAQAGNAEAQYWVGGMYYSGEGVPKDIAVGIQWYRKSAANGYADAKEMLPAIVSELDLRAGSDRTALAQLTAFAQSGDAHAQSRLAFHYHAGLGVPKDSALAASWYRKAALQGDDYAQEELAEDYILGDGLPKDVAEGLRWRRRAAEQGNASAQWSLGTMYAEGEGVPKDFVTAYMWCNLAGADAGPAGAVARGIRDKLEQQMTPDQIADAQRLSREWKPTK